VTTGRAKPTPPGATVRSATPERATSWRATFRQARILILLLILAAVSVTTCRTHYLSTRWRVPLYVAIYPIAADASPVTRAYVGALDAERFKPIDGFFEREAKRYGVGIDNPVKTRLRPALVDHPPQRAPDASILATALWSLKLRYWAFRESGHVAEPEDIRMFVLYHDPALTPVVPHSLGIPQGLIGVVYAFAAPDMDGTNDVVIAHELLHTVGATDKYDPGTNAPTFPSGYGDPRQVPLYPQGAAELMAGRRMLSATRWEQPDDLDEVVVGPATALEIRWLKRTD
jgi:uncharacterized integral membrane protein